MKLIFCILTALASLAAQSAWAQEANILGLPAVPQKPLNAPAVGASGAGASNAARPLAGTSGVFAPNPALITDADAKSVLSGGVTMASSYTHTLATLRITTNTQYPDEAKRKRALLAGSLVQRDLTVACGTQCKPATMPAPKILPDGRLQFELVVKGFNRLIVKDDMLNMLMGLPLATGPANPAITAIAATPARASASLPARSAKGLTGTAVVSSTPAPAQAAPAPVVQNALPAGVVATRSVIVATAVQTVTVQ